MGIFSFLSPTTPLSIAEKLRDAALSLDVTAREASLASELGVDVSMLVNERLLLRISLTRASVSLFHNQRPHPGFWEVGDLLDKFFRDYMLTRLGLSQEAAERLYTRAKDDYGLKMPEDLAKRMVTNLCRGKQRQLMPRVQSEFFGQVHLYAQDTILRVGELTKKLHT